MSIIYVPFTLSHYDAVYAMWQATPGVGLSSADSREAIAVYLARNPGMSFLACDGEAVVGALLAGHDGRRGYLHHLAVLPTYRRRGIGSELVNRCLDALQAEGIQKAHLFIFNQNESGIAFWESQGWQFRTDISVMSKVLT